MGATQPFRAPRAETAGTALACGLIAALAALAVYWPALDNGYVWDDWILLDVFNTAGMRDPASWRDALLRPPADFAALFRPLTMSSFLLQMWSGQVEPRPYHLVNIALHAVNALMLAVVAWRLLGDGTSGGAPRALLASLSGVAYAMHPALTEPVIWISARADLLVTAFLTLALVVDRWRPAAAPGTACAIGILFFLALLCKETALGFVAALPAVHLAVGASWNGSIRPSSLARALAPHSRVYIALAGALILYLAARFAATGASLGTENMVSPARYIDSPGQHVLVVATTLAQHVWTAVWPFQNMVPGRQLPLPIRVSDVLPVLAASGCLVALTLAAARGTAAVRTPALLAVAFLGALLPVANIVPIPAVVVPDEIAIATRYLTLPLTYACLALPLALRASASFLTRFTRHAHVLIGVVMTSWLLVSVANDRVIIPLWKNDVALNTWAIGLGGGNFWRHANIGAHYLMLGEYDRARSATIAAIRLRDDEHSAWVWNNLGLAELALGNGPQAMAAFRRALELGTDGAKSRINIAKLERAAGNAGAAVDVLEGGLSPLPSKGRARPHEVQLRYELGLAYAALGRAAEAAAQFGIALELSRDPRERRAIEEASRSVESQ